MREKLPGITNQEIKQRIEPAIEATQLVGRDMYGLQFGSNRKVTENIGEVSFPDNITLSGVGERVDRLDARTERHYPDGSRTDYHAYRDEKAGVQATRIVRRDREGKVVRELNIRRPVAIALVADRAVERIVEQAHSKMNAQ